MNKAERNYCVTDRELLAVKHFTENFRHYLIGRTFTIRTDHQALKWLFSLKEPKNRIARWIEILSAFDFKIEHRPGLKHQNADALSRCPGTPEEQLLRCGPCGKCNKRSLEMESDMVSVPETAEMVRQISRETVVSGQSLFAETIASISRMTQIVWLFISFMFCLLQPITKPKDVIRKITNTPWLQGYSWATLKRKQEDDPDIGLFLNWFKGGQCPQGTDVNSSSPAAMFYWNCWNSLELHHGILFRKFTGFYWFGVRDDVDIWIRQCDL